MLEAAEVTGEKRNEDWCRGDDVILNEAQRNEESRQAKETTEAETLTSRDVSLRST